MRSSTASSWYARFGNVIISLAALMVCVSPATSRAQATFAGGQSLFSNTVTVATAITGDNSGSLYIAGASSHAGHNLFKVGQPGCTGTCTPNALTNFSFTT